MQREGVDGVEGEGEERLRVRVREKDECRREGE